mgnify:CR=1 FL=1
MLVDILLELCALNLGTLKVAKLLVKTGVSLPYSSI